MGIAVDTFRFNDNVLSWESCEFEILGVQYEGLTSISTGQKRQRKKVKGMRKSGTPLGKTAGSYDAGPIKIRFLVDTWEMIKTTQLTALGLGSYGDASFTLSLTAFEIGLLPLVFAATGCTVEDEEDVYEES